MSSCKILLFVSSEFLDIKMGLSYSHNLYSKPKYIGSKLKCDFSFRVGDLVFYAKTLWMVHSAGKNKQIILQMIVQNNAIIQFIECESALVVLVRSCSKNKNYEEWIDLASRTLGHYTDILDNTNLLFTTIKQNIELSSDYRTLQYLPDIELRDKFIQHIFDRAAAKHIRSLPITQLSQPRPSSRFPPS